MALLVSTKTLLRPILCFMLLLGLSSCSDTESPTLRIGLNHWIGYAPLYLSYASNPPKSNEYQVIPFGSASDVMHSLRNGTLEAGALTLDEAITLSNEGIELDIIMIFDMSYGGDALLTKQGLNSIQHLKGKSIAVEHTAVGAVLLSGALKSVGLSNSDVLVKNCPFNKHTYCYEQYDAVVTFEPVLTELKSKGAVELFSSKEIPGQIIDVLAVRSDIHKYHKDQLRNVTQAYFKVRDKLHTKGSDYYDELTEFTQLDKEQLGLAFLGIQVLSLKENIEFMTGENPRLKKSAEDMKQFLIEHNFIRDRNGLAIHIDPSYLH